jgi:hypothetical protein
VIVQCEIAKEVSMLALWSAFIFCWLCARFHFFAWKWTTEGRTYGPHIANYKELVYLSPSWFTDQEGLDDDDDLFAVGDDGDDNGNGIPHSRYSNVHKRHADSDTCSFIKALGPEILTQEITQCGVFGLGILLVLQCDLIHRRAAGRWEAYTKHLDDNFLSTLGATLLYFTLEMLVGFQQYMVMVPLTAISVNEYCLYVDVPVDTKDAICQFKIMSAAVPFAIVTAPTGYVLSKLAVHTSLFDSDNDALHLPILCCDEGNAVMYALTLGCAFVGFFLLMYSAAILI